MRELEQQSRVEVASATKPIPIEDDELVLYDVESAGGEDQDKDFAVSGDVSFPIEVQEHDSLAEQLEKLRRLRDDGIINDEELAIAKTKLLA